MGVTATPPAGNSTLLFQLMEVTRARPTVPVTFTMLTIQSIFVTLLVRYRGVLEMSRCTSLVRTYAILVHQ